MTSAEPLSFSGETFCELIDKFLRWGLHKGMPSLFIIVRPLYTDPDKVCCACCKLRAGVSYECTYLAPLAHEGTYSTKPIHRSQAE